MSSSKKSGSKSDHLSLKNEVTGIFLLFFSLFFFFSIISYSAGDRTFFFNPADTTALSNFCGRVGAEISAISLNLIGVSSYALVLYTLFLSAYFFLNCKLESIITKSAGFALLLISSASFLSNVLPDSGSLQIRSCGGIIGYFINYFISNEIGSVFGMLLFLLLMLLSFTLIARFSLKSAAVIVGRLLLKLMKFSGAKFSVFAESYQSKKRVKKIENKYNIKPEKKKKVKKESSSEVVVKDTVQTKKEDKKAARENTLFPELEETEPGDLSYQAPPVTYLDAPGEKEGIDIDLLEEKRQELAYRLEEFRIKGSISEYTPGPVVTTYEFVPDAGVKVKDVVNLAEDLALVVKAQYVRIERVLGKKAIGIEIPNDKREMIYLREIIESDEYRRSKSPLSIALGKTKNGEICVTDLKEMPHLIVAGATGAGKSVAIHTIILSIIFKSPPEDVKFILIDPKCVELVAYNSLPHLLTPVVVNMKLAKNSLDWAVWEMEQRYKKLAAIQVRNIDQYNRKIELLRHSDEELPENIKDTDKMQYIVIVIDEFADLIMVSSKEVEESVARIAQKARAVGIHLILATQRPSTDVITGTIKNNFPSRMALAVPSKFDSRTIIDVIGAEKLLGRGDMLFLPPKTASLIRVHCAFVSEEEAHRVVKFLAKNEKQSFNTEVVKPLSQGESNGNGKDGLDELFFQAAETVINTGSASTSFLQRKMSVGYARAGRLMDQLQSNGVVSAPNSRNQREILMTLEDVADLRDEVEGDE